MLKTVVISATKISIDPVSAAAEGFDDIQIVHLLDEGMSLMCREEGHVSEKNLASLKKLIQRAEDLDADGILLSCTIFSPFIDEIGKWTSVPVVAADIGVFQRAASLYDEIGAVVSFEPTVETVQSVVTDCREKINENFHAEIGLAKGAFDALAEGRKDEHDRLIFETGKKIAAGREAIVLSQMSHLSALSRFKDFGIPVLTSPSVSLGILREQMRAKKK